MTFCNFGSLFCSVFFALKPLFMPGGRPFDPVWNHFKREETASGPRASCRGCLTAFAGKGVFKLFLLFCLLSGRPRAGRH